MSSTPEQRDAALSRANEVRTARSRWKRELRALSRDGAMADARRRLLAPPWWLQTMTVFDLFTAIPWIGPSRARLTFAGCKVNPRRRVGDLVPRQRQALADWLGARVEELRAETAA